MMRPVMIVMLALGLSACGDRDQSLTASSSKPDGKPWEGAKNPHILKNWTPGDKISWESQLRQRAQNQNEYAKAN